MTDDIADTAVRILRTEPLNERSVMFIEVNVGLMPPQRVKQYLESIAEQIKAVVEPARVILVPRRPDDPSLNIQVVEVENLTSQFDRAKSVLK